MRIPQFLRSRHSSSPKPPQEGSGSLSNAAGVDVPKLKSSHRVRGFFSPGRPRKQKPPEVSSDIAIVVPSPSCTSLEPVQDGPSNFVPPSNNSSQLITSPIALNVAQSLSPPGPVASHSIRRASPSPTADTDPDQRQDLLVMPRPPSVTASQLSLVSQTPTMPPLQQSSQPPDRNSNQTHTLRNLQITNESRNAYVDGNYNHVNYTTTYNASSNKFMQELLEKTIQGAAFDSSDRDPPPRCHPGTRLAILERCLEFITSHAGGPKMLWVVGQAGVGKSAIMQNIAESPLPSVPQRASIFLSINGRSDGSKLIITLVYQLAIRCQPYREFIELQIAREPSLLRSSMSVQFKRLLIEPFINNPVSNFVGQILIIIDGLDECDKPETQREFLRLITGICSAHTSSPIVWIIASRPEHHITSFFARDDVQAVYEKEEIQVDSDEARSDVESFLRAELADIQKEFSLSPGSQWPREQDVWKLASAAGGLFVYAQIVTKYIGDLTTADPISQLEDVLKVIDALPLSGVPREQHPLVLLDALYARILSKVPKRVMVNTRKILLALVLDLGSDSHYRRGGFLVLCNWLGMTCDDAYTAIRHLGAVLDVPERGKAHDQKLRSFHKSFIDYVSDFNRSGFSSNIKHEAQQLDAQYTIRILDQAPSGIDCSGLMDDIFLSTGYICGGVTCVPGAGTDIVLTWPADEDSNWSDKETRLAVYKWAFANVVEGIVTRQSVFCTEFYIHMVVTHIVECQWGFFPHEAVIDLVFEKSRRHEFTESGLLKRVPIKDLDFSRVIFDIKLQFRRPSRKMINLSDPWSSSCSHKRVGTWGEGNDEDWTTKFNLNFRGCPFCRQRLEKQVEDWKTRYPDHDVTILLTSARITFLEFRFNDPDDDTSEWTYWMVLEVSEDA